MNGSIIPNPTCGIYLIENIVKHRLYVGSSVNVRLRWNTHISSLRRGTHTNTKLQHAFNKYGEPAFVLRVIETCLREQLATREQYWIDHLDSVKTGYNIMPKAYTSAGNKRTPAQCQRQAQGIRRWLNDHPEIIERRRQITKARYEDPEERKRQSERLKLALSKPEVRAKWVEASRRKMADPKRRQAKAGVMAAMRRKQKEAKRAAKLARKRQLFQDPEIRRRISDGTRKGLAKPGVRERLSEARRREGNTPEERARRSARGKARYENPIERELQAERTRNSWNDPTIREKRIQGLREAAERRKASAKEIPQSIE
jgi:group I intron endonuclease